MRYTTKVNETDYVLNENAEENPFEMRNTLGQLEDIEERLGIDLVKYLKLQLDGGYFKVPDRVAEEFCTSFKPNQIVGRIPDSVSPEGIRITYYDMWDDTCEPIKYLYSWANEGKTWASTKEGLK